MYSFNTQGKGKRTKSDPGDGILYLLAQQHGGDASRDRTPGGSM
jgi:hypothetical protein